MKIVADDKIPFLRGVLEPFADVHYLPGKEISNSHLKDADALLIRTRTRCDRDLLNGSAVKFIATATIGFDHIDTAYCEANDIVWKNAPGCNAASVGQYVAAALFTLSEKYGFALKNRVLGVVGVGNVGSKVVYFAEMLGMKVYLCDPPRVRQEGLCGFISIDGILRECDILSFHVPLNYDGVDKTHRLIGKDLLSRVNKGSFIINTSRGEVGDEKAMKEYLLNGRLAGLVIDVWENEPLIDRELLSMTAIATPHIAGYSVDGKARATSIIIDELSKFFDLGLDGWEPELMPVTEGAVLKIDCNGKDEETILKTAVQHTYQIINDDNELRSNPGNFEKIRGNYPPRREYKAFTIELENYRPEIKRTLRKTGFNVR